MHAGPSQYPPPQLAPEIEQKHPTVQQPPLALPGHLPTGPQLQAPQGGTTGGGTIESPATY